MLSTHISSNSSTQPNLNDNSNSFLSVNNSHSQLCSYAKNTVSTEALPPKPLKTPINVCFIGAGYVGGTSSAVMAYKCPEDTVTVTVCDISPEKINAWNSDKVKL